MRFKDFLRKYGINVDTELIINIIMLLIPGIRFIGAFWMYSRIQRKHGFMGIKKFALFMLTLLIATGTITEIVSDVLWPLTAVGLAALAVFFFARKNRDVESEVQSCLMGRSSISLDELSKTLDLSERQIERAVRSLKKQGRLPATAYIDKSKRAVIITPEGRPQADKNAGRRREEESPNEEQSPIREKTKYEKILYQIRYINEQIADKAMTEKIYHIENTTANIFHLVEQKPERADEIQTFMEYYLPTTMNLLYKYSQLEKQGDVGGENIASAKRDIEGIMDKVVEGFDTQLDKLFKSDAIDITNDVKVLEKMMRMDKLNK